MPILCVLLVALSATLPSCFAESSAPATRVLASAQACVGKKMWFGYGLNSGTLGCAAALSNILNQSGFPSTKSAAVVVLRNKLLSSPIKAKELVIKNTPQYGVDPRVLDTVASPGDLIMGYKQPPTKPNLGGDAHCGVVAGNGEVYANDWNDGIWKRAQVDRFFAWYPYVYVMKLPPSYSSPIQPTKGTKSMSSGFQD